MSTIDLTKPRIILRAGKKERVDLSSFDQKININNSKNLYCQGVVVVNSVVYKYSLFLDDFKCQEFFIDRDDNKKFSYETKSKAEKVITELLVDAIMNIPNIHELFLRADFVDKSWKKQNLQKDIQEKKDEISNMEEQLSLLNIQIRSLEEDLVDLTISGN